MNILSAGMPAPDFSRSDWQGHPINLSDYRGRKLLLSFFRNAACAMCNLRVHQLRQAYADWSRHGIEIIAVFESSADSLGNYVGRQNAPFPIIGDPEGLLYRLYGVENSESIFQKTVEDPGTKIRIQEAADIGYALTKEAGANMNRVPADFLIGPDGIIQAAYYGKLVTDHLPLEAVSAFART